MLSIVIVHGLRWAHPSSDPANDLISAAGPALALLVAVGFASVVKSLLLSKLLNVPVGGWKGSLVVAVIIAALVGYATLAMPEWFQLSIGICVILGSYGAVIWRWGFTKEDRVLFRMSSALPPPLREAARNEGFRVDDQARGFVFNADLVAVLRFLDIGTVAARTLR